MNNFQILIYVPHLSVKKSMTVFKTINGSCDQMIVPHIETSYQLDIQIGTIDKK